MRAILVRHGKTERSEKGIIQGQLDGGLSKNGGRETEKLADELKHVRIDVMYVSDLERSVETADIIARHHKGVDYELRDRLRERDYGSHQGKHHSECWDEYLSLCDRDAPGGEEFGELKKRVKGFVEELYSRHLNDTVLVVSHRCPIMAMLSLFLDIPCEEACKKVPDYSKYIALEVDKISAEEIRLEGGKVLGLF